MHSSRASSIPNSSPQIKRRRALIGLPLLVLAAFCAALAIGSSDVSLVDALKALWRGDRNDSAWRIVAYIRLPRALGAVLAGAALFALSLGDDPDAAADEQRSEIKRMMPEETGVKAVYMAAY